RKLTIAPKRAHRGALNMSSLQSSEEIQVNEAVGAFSKLESEIGELVRRDATASRLQQGHDNELVSSLQSLDRIQVNEGAAARRIAASRHARATAALCSRKPRDRRR